MILLKAIISLRLVLFTITQSSKAFLDCQEKLKDDDKELHLVLRYGGCDGLFHHFAPNDLFDLLIIFVPRVFSLGVLELIEAFGT